MGLRWVCVWALGMTSAVAQESTGSIAGMVVDMEGAVIPNTAVTVVSPASLETKTDAMGEFVLDDLAPGAYELRFHQAGFRTKGLGSSG